MIFIILTNINVNYYINDVDTASIKLADRLDRERALRNISPKYTANQRYHNRTISERKNRRVDF
jgi:transcriptional regulator of NAD metabolism